MTVRLYYIYMDPNVHIPAEQYIYGPLVSILNVIVSTLTRDADKGSGVLCEVTTFVCLHEISLVKYLAASEQTSSLKVYYYLLNGKPGEI